MPPKKQTPESVKLAAAPGRKEVTVEVVEGAKGGHAGKPFVPGEKLTMRLDQAERHGKNVRIISGAPPARTEA